MRRLVRNFRITIKLTDRFSCVIVYDITDYPTEAIK